MSKDSVFKETNPVAVGELIVSLLTVLVFALLNKLVPRVWLGALTGFVLATLNYFIMVFTAYAISNKADDPEKAKTGAAKMRLNYTLRLVAMFVILALLAKNGLIDPVAAIIPLILMQPIIILVQYLRQRKVK